MLFRATGTSWAWLQCAICLSKIFQKKNELFQDYALRNDYSSKRHGRWRQEATTFLRLLAHTKARAAPDILRQAVQASLLSRWSAILTHAAQHAFAASLLDLDCAGTSTVDGDGPSTSQLLSEAPVQPPHTSRVPARP